MFSLKTLSGGIWLFALIIAVNSQNDTEFPLSAEAESNNTVSGPKCDTQKMVDECFKDLPPHLMEFLQKTKVSINEEEIASKCTVFYRGMKCFDDYTARCLTKRKLMIFKNNVEGAKRFFRKFCGDPDFQNDYLQHKDCFSYIQQDWVRCTKTFHLLISEELHSEKKNVTDKFMEFCCARHAYENCIYNSARFKCYSHSAKFARATAQMLSEEKHFTNCRQYENTLCNRSSGCLWRNEHTHQLIGCLILLPLLLPMLRRSTTLGY